ncbi:MAG: glycosyltransferase [Actinobacteria bacterium]|nr:glycosyltransferase [Actinomycetota bacterium]
MRIALLDPPNFTAPYDHSLASALARRGHDVHLLTSPYLFGEALEAHGYRRHETFLPLSGRVLRRAPRSRLRRLVKGAEYVPSVWSSQRRLRSLAPDVVHVQWLGSPRFDVRWLGRLAARYPTLLTAHDVLPRRARNAEAWGRALGLVDRVVVHSERAVETLAEAGVARRRLTRIPHAVFEAPPGYRPTEPGGTMLLFFGLIRGYKGLDVLLRALPSIPEARLVVAGDPLEPAEPLVRLAEELGVAERVEWRLRFIADDEARGLFEDAALAVLPYRRLDSSGVLATALGLGRPAVVTDVGSLGGIVREYGAGRVVPPEDAAAFAAACRELLSDTDALAAAARGARAARDALTWDAAAAEHERVYGEVLAERA